MDDRDIIGWFMISFNDDVDHEYPFAVYQNNQILPELTNYSGDDIKEVFYKYLQDPNLHNVRFISHSKKK